MLFAIRCQDRPNSEALRAANRTQHLAYLRALGERLKLAGPLLTDDGETMRGSLLVIEFDDRAAAEVFAAGDPYAAAGLFGEVSIDRFHWVLP